MWGNIDGSHPILNDLFGASKTAWIAVVNSTTPSPAPRCPPVSDTIDIVSDRSSLASCVQLGIR